MAKRNHHKQPNFYLKGFKSSDEGNPKVWVYEKGKPFFEGKNEKLQNPKHLTTEKAARQKDYYAFEKEDGTKEYEKYENILRDDFEEPAKPVIEKIRRFEEINNTDEKEKLSKYIASMRTRGDYWREIYLKKLRAIDEEICKKEETILGEQNPNESMIRVANNNYHKFLNLKWRFLKMPNKMRLFTSDNPVIIVGDIRDNYGQVFFPISEEIVVSLINGDVKEPKSWEKISDNYWKIDDKTVELLRNEIALMAIKEVYYSQKAEWLVKFINNRNYN